MTDLAQIDAIDLLALWRTVSIDDIEGPVAARLAGALIERAREAEKTEEQQALLLRAQARDADAWIRLGEFYLRNYRLMAGAGGLGPWLATNGVASCLFVATYHGSKWAAVLLVLRLARLDIVDAEPTQVVELMGALSSRFSISSCLPTSMIEGFGVLDEIAAGIRPNAPEAGTLKEEDDKGDADLPGATVRVILSAPATTGDRDIKAIIEQHAILQEPIALSVMPNPDDLAAGLAVDFPWASAVIDEIHAELHFRRRLGRPGFQLPPLLILGEPGIGKSTFVRRLCTLASASSATILAGGATDHRVLAGTARGWSSATPSFPLATIRRFLVANPILVIEEIDKAGGSDSNGRLADKLSSMIDPTLSASWLDECLLVPIDISHITWIMTANRLDLVAPAIRARCRLLNFPRPRPTDFAVLMAGIYRDIAEQYSTDAAAFPELPSVAIDELRRGFERGQLQARQLANLVRRAMALEAAGDSSQTKH